MMLRWIPLALLTLLALAGCSVLKPLPEPVSVADRLKSFPRQGLPLKHSVTIHWHPRMIPFIEASDDGDAAFALGLVHAHLRWGQLEIFRYVAAGRLACLVGPLAVDIDHSLRLLNLTGAAAESEKLLPPQTRLWLERFVDGLNFYATQAKEKPFEFDLLDIEPQPWTVRDLLAAGRLFAADVNWLTMFRLIPLTRDEHWPQIWARTLAQGAASIPSYRAGAKLKFIADLLAGMSKAGSNALAVAPAKTAQGAALLAGDPHLGISLPNFWLIGGIKSPNYHLAGLMIPGTPFVAVGRNRHLAWGGTNMRAASSDLYSLARVDPSEFKIKKEKIEVRWWLDKEVELRFSELGPVISDAPPLKWDGPPFALKWVGHQPSDEISAFLAAGRAENGAQFRAAFKTYAVSSQNLLFADDQGNIGQIPAVRLPIRGYDRPPHLFLDPTDPAQRWQGLADPTQLPAGWNPPQGFIASANNAPYQGRPPVGFFFQSNDRIQRLEQVLAGRQGIDIDFLKKLQRDVYSAGAVQLRDYLLSLAARALAGGEIEKSGDSAGLLSRLKAWDGNYGAQSSGAAAFQVLLAHLAPAFYIPRWGDKLGRSFLSRSGLERILLQDLKAAPSEEVESLLAKVWPQAAKRAAEVKTWGQIHRLKLGHLLANVPLIGSKYRAFDRPVGGSYSTLMKTAHTCTDKVHNTTFGSQARQLHDLADLDANWFVLLGGQDGRPNSGAWIDQVELWEKGEYVHVPLRMENVRKEFSLKTVLHPVR